MKWQLIITKADNGFIIESQAEVDGGIIDRSQVFEDNEGQLECAKDMLEHVKDYFDVTYSKHNKRNLIIEIEEKGVDD